MGDVRERRARCGVSGGRSAAFGLDGDDGERVGEDVVHLVVDAHVFLQDGQSRTHVAVMFGHDPAFFLRLKPHVLGAVEPARLPCCQHRTACEQPGHGHRPIPRADDHQMQAERGDGQQTRCQASQSTMLHPTGPAQERGYYCHELADQRERTIDRRVGEGSNGSQYGEHGEPPSHEHDGGDGHARPYPISHARRAEQ